MNIDLLLTRQGDAGLICDTGFESPVAGVLFDAQMRQMTLEFANMDTADMNIPVEDDMTEALLWATAIQVGVVGDGKIQDSRRVPLMLLNDPDGMPGRDLPVKSSSSVRAFENFLKNCVAGQPLHRADLGNEGGAGSVVGGINRAVLEFAPHLARQRTLEASHDLNMGGPAAPGPKMGGGGSSPPPLRRRPPVTEKQTQPPPDEEEDG